MGYYANLPILPTITTCLKSLADETPIIQISPVGGGCIHRVFCITTEKRPYLLKWNPNPPAHIFNVEAKGLILLARSGVVRVPEVLALNQQPDFILLEWIDLNGGSSQWDQERLGSQLATLHKSETMKSYGLNHNNYIGATVQINDWRTNWDVFFRDCRLEPQIHLAIQKGALNSTHLRKLTWICDHLDLWIDLSNTKPSLLHGDLWAGNVICASDGQPVLIDPAVYYGDREAELAFTELFGGFTQRFYQAYNETWPLAPGYRDRKDLYNLYHLLNHLNIFGAANFGQVLAVINRYAGI